MIVLGLDPGSTENALVTLDLSARPRLVQWAKVDHDTLAAMLLTTSADALVIELVEGVAFEPWRAADLFKTQRPACIAEGIAIARGLRHECLSGRTWRGEWLRYPTASDKAIRLAVESVIDFAPDLPRIYADDRKHLYDAIGVVLGASPRLGLPRVEIPAETQGFIIAEMDAVRGKAATKRKATLARKARAA